MLNPLSFYDYHISEGFDQKARNEFLRHALAEMNLSVDEYVSLGQEVKDNRDLQLQAAFKTEFFQFTRDGDWMAAAVGDNREWIALHEMSQWMRFHCTECHREGLFLSSIDQRSRVDLVSGYLAASSRQKDASEPLPMPQGEEKIWPLPFNPVKNSMRGSQRQRN